MQSLDLAFYLGWLAAPLTQLFGFVACFSERLLSWPGGLGSLAWWLGCFVLLLVSVSSNFESPILLVTRVGLMPCSAWSQKKYECSRWINASLHLELHSDDNETVKNTSEDGHSYAVQGVLRENSQ